MRGRQVRGREDTRGEPWANRSSRRWVAQRLRRTRKDGKEERRSHGCTGACKRADGSGSSGSNFATAMNDATRCGARTESRGRSLGPFATTWCGAPVTGSSNSSWCASLHPDDYPLAGDTRGRGYEYVGTTEGDGKSRPPPPNDTGAETERRLVDEFSVRVAYSARRKHSPLCLETYWLTNFHLRIDNRDSRDEWNS